MSQFGGVVASTLKSVGITSLACFVTASLGADFLDKKPLQAEPSVEPPKARVSLVFPTPSAFLAANVYVRIKADVFDPGSSITSVKFLAGTDVIGIATDQPFSVVWITPSDTPPEGLSYTEWRLIAIATNKSGGTVTSTPVVVRVFPTAQPRPLARITSPFDGNMFAAPASFDVGAELLIGADGFGMVPLEFYVGTDLVGTVRQEPYAIAVRNLSVGDYKISLKDQGSYGFLCDCALITIRVVSIGITSLKVSSDGHVEGDILTAFPGKETRLERSSNLQHWTSIATNIPTGKIFHFADSVPFDGLPHFYRAAVLTTR